MKTLHFAFFAIALILFTACGEYEYEKPLTSSCKAKIDTSFIGFWRFVGYKTYNNFQLQIDSHLLAITPLNKHEYVIIVQSTKEQSLPLIFKAHLTRIKNLLFANTQLLDGNFPNNYGYYTVKIENDTLFYWGFIKNKLPHVFNAKKFFSQYANDTTFISAVRMYKRMKIRFF